MKRKILGKKFFERPVLEVAPALLGKYLVRKIGKKEITLRIIEVEAYNGTKDLANHASKGRTARTKVMFGEAGRFYVYLVYGMYFMLNIVTCEKNYPAAVLIRGVQGQSGPGKVTRVLKIKKKINGKTATKSSGLWFEDRGEPRYFKIKKTPRIGVSYAGQVWSKKYYRFVLERIKI